MTPLAAQTFDEWWQHQRKLPSIPESEKEDCRMVWDSAQAQQREAIATQVLTMHKAGWDIHTIAAAIRRGET